MKNPPFSVLYTRSVTGRLSDLPIHTPVTRFFSGEQVFSSLYSTAMLRDVTTRHIFQRRPYETAFVTTSSVFARTRRKTEIDLRFSRFTLLRCEPSRGCPVLFCFFCPF